MITCIDRKNRTIRVRISGIPKSWTVYYTIRTDGDDILYRVYDIFTLIFLCFVRPRSLDCRTTVTVGRSVGRSTPIPRTDDAAMTVVAYPRAAAVLLARPTMFPGPKPFWFLQNLLCFVFFFSVYRLPPFHKTCHLGTNLLCIIRGWILDDIRYTYRHNHAPRFGLILDNCYLLYVYLFTSIRIRVEKLP